MHPHLLREVSSAPSSSRLALLQIDDRKLGILNTKRRETCIQPAIEEFQSQHIAIEPHGSFHVSDLQGDSGDLFNFRLHRGSSLSRLTFVEFASETHSVKWRRCRMAYVIAEPGIGVKDASCVDACQVDCIHPKKNTSYEDPRPGFDEVPQLYIDPVECIDCGACVPVCPVCQPFFR